MPMCHLLDHSNRIGGAVALLEKRAFLRVQGLSDGSTI